MHIALTGASSGIGAAFAREFARHGHSLTLVARRKNLLDELAESLPTRCFVYESDLSQPAQAASFLAPAQHELGPIDVLVNNAGVQIIEHTMNANPEEGERLLALNLLTPLRLIRSVLPSMVERGSGTIVNIASMASLAPTPGMTYYNASKGGLAGASEALRGELRKTGVNVLTVYPGIIDETDMGSIGLTKYTSSALLRWMPRGTTKRLAELTTDAIERKRARVIHPISNGLARTFPNVTRWLMDTCTPPLASQP